MKSMAWSLSANKYVTFLLLMEMDVGMGTVIYGNGWGQLFAGMDGDGDDLKTSRRDRGGDGDQSCGDGQGWV